MDGIGIAGGIGVAVSCVAAFCSTHTTLHADFVVIVGQKGSFGNFWRVHHRSHMLQDREDFRLLPCRRFFELITETVTEQRRCLRGEFPSFVRGDG